MFLTRAELGERMCSVPRLCNTSSVSLVSVLGLENAVSVRKLVVWDRRHVQTVPGHTWPFPFLFTVLAVRKQ
jgi:hypothetical protein